MMMKKHANHADEEEQEVGGTRNSNNNSQPYTNASFNICTLEQLELMHGLPMLWLLLNSCSTFLQTLSPDQHSRCPEPYLLPLRTWHPTLNTTAANKHVSEQN
jgi:hypothetical protein